MTNSVLTDQVIPEEVARAATMPESYTDEEGVTYPAFRWLRENNPFGQAVLEGYKPFWVATRHADIMTIEKNGGLFASGIGIAEPNLNDIAGSAFLESVAGGKRTLDTLASMDAPEHTVIKNITSRWFLPASVRKREELIRDLARSAVRDLLDSGGECDFVKDFALLYPLRVLMVLFGVPQSEEATFLKITQEFFGASDPEEQRAEIAPEPGAAARMFKAAILEFFEYFNELSADRRKNPTDDLASIIANAKVDGEYLPDSYVNGYYMAIATAGHDTTASTISSTALAFTRDASQLDAVRGDMTLLPGLIEEALRWTSPVKHFMRTVTADTEFAGRRLAEGDRVMLLYPSANRDEAVFSDPDTFDLRRKPNRHIAFGYGPHMCIGQHVAKIEMRILFEELLPHLASIERTGPTKSVASNFLSGLKTLPVRFTTA